MNQIKRYAIPILLALVATIQLVVVHCTELSRWEGGGFGMYSELSPMTKHVIIDVSGSSSKLSERGERELAEATHWFEVIPDHRRLEAIAEILSEHGIKPFRIEAWEERFDLRGRTVTLKRIGRLSDSGVAE